MYATRKVHKTVIIAAAAIAIPTGALLAQDAQKGQMVLILEVWSEANFKKYIQNPQGVIPGTQMIFPGVKNEQQVNDLWAYLSQFAADGTKK